MTAAELLPGDTHLELSPNFALAEFACRSGDPFPAPVVANLRRLCVAALQPIREAWAAPLVVICGYRSPAYNEALFRLSEARAQAAGRAHGGVARMSRHLTGEAADVRPLRPADLMHFYGMIQRMIIRRQLDALGGLGYYPTSGWLHLDIRPRPQPDVPVRWIGDGAGSEP